MRNLIYIEKVLTDEQCDALVRERESRDSEGSRERSNNALTDVLTESTFEQVELIPDTDNFGVVHDASEKVINGWMKHLKTFDMFAVGALEDNLRYSHKYRLMRYKEGQWIHPHIDWHHLCSGSLSIALNDETEYTGGNFKFFNDYNVRLKKGEAMVFPANPFFVHEVTPIETGTRYSVNSFLESLPFNDSREIGNEISQRMDWYEQHPTPWFYESSKHNHPSRNSY